jgi:hypothetical protein
MKRILPIQDFRRPIAWICVLAAAGLIICLLMIPPVIGMADNGDFARVMSVSGIAPLDPGEAYEDRYFAYFHSQYAYGSFTPGGYVSTHVLLVAVSGLVSRIFNGQTYDIRFLGAFYLLFFLTALFLLVRFAPAPGGKKATAAFAAALGALVVWIFGDIGYTAYFQSFYGEPYALIGMLLAVASALAISSMEKPTGGLLVLFIGAALAVASSKIQNAPLGFAFALLAWRMMGLRQDRRWHRQVLAGVCVLIAGSVIMIVAAPDRLKHTNLYQSIFYGVLKDSPDVAGDMRELGIPEKYAVLAGTNYFQKDTAIPQRDPTLRKEVLEKLSHKDIALFYLKHPGRFVGKLEKAAANGAFIRPYYLGNYEKEAGKPPGALSYEFSSWSEWKAKRMPHTYGWFAAVYALFAAGLAAWWLRRTDRKSRLKAETLAVVALTGVMAIMIPIVGDGEADLGKHLFMFNVSFDMIVFSVLAGAVYGIFRIAAAGRFLNRKG